MTDVLTEGANPPLLSIRYNNATPVELSDLTTSLTALSRRFARYVAQNDFELPDNEMKLYVREIKQGSIIVDLTNYAVNSMPPVVGMTPDALKYAAEVNAVISFAKNIRDGFNWLIGKGSKPETLSPAELSDLSRIVEPTAKDGKGNVQITAYDGAQVQVTINYNSTEANAIQNRAAKEIEQIREPSQKTFTKVLMYWHQASRSTASKSDKVVIDSISDRPLKVIFGEGDQEIKRRMISGRENPFTVGFIVDVELLTVKGRPYAYLVTHLYEVLEDDKPEDDDAAE